VNPKKSIKSIDYKRLPDEELAYKFVHRQDAQGLYQLYERYAHLVFGISVQKMASVSRAKEVTHQLFLSFFDVLPHAQIVNFKAWLFDYTTAFIEGTVSSASHNDLLAPDALYDNTSKRNSFEDARASSACITKKQLSAMLAHSLSSEEEAMLQMHTATCPVCSVVLKGAHAHAAATGLVLAELSPVYLKDHHNLLYPRIHMNALAIASPSAAPLRRRAGKLRKPAGLRPTAIVMAIMLGFGLLWYFEFGKTATPSVETIQTAPVIEKTVRGTAAAQPVASHAKAAPTPEKAAVMPAEPATPPAPGNNPAKAVQPTQGEKHVDGLTASAQVKPVAAVVTDVQAQATTPIQAEDAVNVSLATDAAIVHD
jgi:DNA-directed RNA polymerase specialized sigma24 family protein